ncbi:hypothetical protein JM93_00353 [Roseibium hamelinense]|uniref:Uncharacterized protein n=1 Tax=Roseibium hamelinense TaxID=150831 RepID=A0A562THS1_9HYPH|nr:hypothetical protein [Roseibium hamelinense]MTI46005.1 hypothetical protein [Roseibium hamelinense]TWI92804.1 hypothetical protein JM93_00353 [Roseibium hamelinense]
MRSTRQSDIKLYSQRLTHFGVFAGATVFLIPSLLPEQFGVPIMLVGLALSIPVAGVLIYKLIRAYTRSTNE